MGLHVTKEMVRHIPDNGLKNHKYFLLILILVKL